MLFDCWMLEFREDGVHADFVELSMRWPDCLQMGTVAASGVSSQPRWGCRVWWYDVTKCT